MSEFPNLVLIDDDELIRVTWQMCAREKGHHILCFESYEDFLRSGVDIRSSIYIDYNLKESVNGFEIAKDLFAKGYQRLFIATGSNRFLVDHPAEVQKIVGKDYPL